MRASSGYVTSIPLAAAIGLPSADLQVDRRPAVSFASSMCIFACLNPLAARLPS